MSSKQNAIATYIDTIIGGTVTTKALCESTGTTLPTVLSFIRNNSSRFEKAGRGKYTIRAASVTNNTTDTNIPSHEW